MSENYISFKKQYKKFNPKSLELKAIQKKGKFHTCKISYDKKPMQIKLPPVETSGIIKYKNNKGYGIIVPELENTNVQEFLNDLHQTILKEIKKIEPVKTLDKDFMKEFQEKPNIPEVFNERNGYEKSLLVTINPEMHKIYNLSHKKINVKDVPSRSGAKRQTHLALTISGLTIGPALEIGHAKYQVFLEMMCIDDKEVEKQPGDIFNDSDFEDE